MRRFAVAAVLTMFVPAAGALAQAPMQPGLWEVTTQMEMPGMSVPPMTTQQCIRDVKPESVVPQAPNCTIDSRSMSGNTMRWSAHCQQGTMTMTGTGEMTMRGTTYDGSLQMTMDDGSGRRTMSTRYSGRRLGDC